MRMKKLLLLGLTVIFILGTMPELAVGQTGKNYDNVTLSQWQWANFDEIWDLDKCDLHIVYRLDMSNIATAGWVVTELGLREVGAANIDPNLKGGWMQSNYISDVANDYYQNINDIHFLSKHGWLFQTYDATDANTLITPYWSGANYGFWFDRDGVDEWQALLWGAINGGTYNTGGEYNIIITYHAIDKNTGTMFATINGVQQGLYIGGWKDVQPEFYPAGRSFVGDMTKMQVFYGRGGGGGTVTISEITVTGCLRMIIIDGCDTGVRDRVIDGDSTTISDCIKECAANSKNHGQFVKCVALLTNGWHKDGIITVREEGAIQNCAAQANIPN